MHILFTVTFLCSLFSALSLTALHAEESIKAKLTLINGEILNTTITEWENETIKVAQPSLSEIVEIKRDDILHMQLLNAEVEETKSITDKGGNFTTILLKNRYKFSGNDVIQGNLLQFNVDHLMIDTPYAGTIEIEKSKVLDVRIIPNSDILYTGPNNAKEWGGDHAKGGWKYKNGNLYSSDEARSLASMRIDFPDKVKISFKQQFKRINRFSVQLCSGGKTENSESSYYSIMFSPSNMNITKYTPNKISKRILATKQNFENISALRQSQTTRKETNYTIYFDKQKGTIHLFGNKKFLFTFQDPDLNPSNGLGSHLDFIAERRLETILSNIQVSRWNGMFPLASSELSALDPTATDQYILLRNGDRFAGEVKQFEDGFANIATEFGVVKVHVDSMKKLDLSSTPKDEIKMYREDVKLHYSDDYSIIVRPISLNGSQLTVYHPAFGEAVMNLNAFKKIDFNIYSKEHNKARREISFRK